MSTETNKRIIVGGFEEGMNQGNLAYFDQYATPTYVNHNMPVPGAGPEAMKMAVGMFKTAFPDFHVTIEEVLAEGDRVSTLGYFTGTHLGDFNGIPATGKSIRAGYIDIWRLENGQVAENWVQMDMMGLLQQLGVIPAPGQ
jgi:steroid delta-isomerase-like uncharacterized protein